MIPDTTRTITFFEIPITLLATVAGWGGRSKVYTLEFFFGSRGVQGERVFLGNPKDSDWEDWGSP